LHLVNIDPSKNVNIPWDISKVHSTEQPANDLPKCLSRYG